MGRDDNRKSKKMRQRQAQKKKKARDKRKAEAARRVSSLERAVRAIAQAGGGRVGVFV